MVRLRRSFVHRSHLCLAFDVLGINLYEMLLRNQFRGFQVEVLCSVVRQVLEAVRQLHALNVIHCDLKPENILLASAEEVGGEEGGREAGGSPEVRVKVTWARRASGSDHVPLHPVSLYRAPEVLLGVPYDGSIDLWSVGCIVAELFRPSPLPRGVRALPAGPDHGHAEVVSASLDAVSRDPDGQNVLSPAPEDVFGREGREKEEDKDKDERGGRTRGGGGGAGEREGESEGEGEREGEREREEKDKRKRKR